MAIDKITPIRLDKSSDYKLVPNTSMVDALNMLITEDDSDGGDGTTGNLGVLKNLKGNQVIEYVAGSTIFSPNAKIIGSVTDTKLKIVYFFVWSSYSAEHGVYAYDQLGKLPGENDTSGKIRKIHKSVRYKFPEHGFVKGNIIYTSQTRVLEGLIKPSVKKDFEKDTILYFTDNTNEPRKLNVYMAMLNEDNSYSQEDKIDFITACPKTPLTPIVFAFNSDSTRTTSNFKSGPGFQFAYQFISKDGVESAISPYSDIAFSPGVINQGTLTSVDHNTHNRCALTIPHAGKEIESIRILARQFNNPELVVLDEVSNESSDDNWSIDSRIYSFYNDRIVKGVSTNEVNKQFDNLPRKAQAQAVVDNRLMYGNYLEGFNNVTTECTSEVTFEERPAEGFDFKLKLVPAISQIKDPAATGDNNSDSQKLGVNKCAGYIIDTGDVPNVIEPNTFITISLSISPDRNFHLYNAENSYHQSRHRGGFAQYEEENIDYSDFSSSGTYGINNPYDQEGEYGHQNRYHSGEKWLEETLSDDDGLIATQNINGEDILWGIPYSGNNFGVTSNNGEVNNQVKWKTVLGEDLVGDESVVTYGTSAGNPLILSGNSATPGENNFTFSCSFLFGANGVGSDGAGKQAISSIVSDLLTGGADAVTWSDGVGGGFLSDVTVKNKHTHVINLGIKNFDKISKNDPENNLVTGVVQPGDSFEPFKPPIGHFIVNKATVQFAFEKDSKYSGLSNDREMIRLVINSIEINDTEGDGIVTVVKKIFAGSPWIALTKNYLENNPADASFFAGVYLGGATMGPLTEQTASYSDFKLSTVQEGMGGFGEGIAGYDLYSILSDNVTTNSALPFLGYLDFQQNGNITNFFNFDREDAYDEIFEQVSEGTPLIGAMELFPFSLLDGEGGPGGELPYSYNNDDVNFGGSDYRSMSLPLNYPYVNVAGPIFTGTINTKLIYGTLDLLAVLVGELENNPSRTSLPLLLGSQVEGLDITTTSGLVAYSSPSGGLFNGPVDQTFSLNFSKKHSHVELLELNTQVGDILGDGGGRTFKSSANHDFGIIYYDERGRHGFVNHLKTVYVPGYSSAERNSPVHGRSKINLKIEHDPPVWAHYYKLAYTKNTSVQNFVQYSAGGAFAEDDDASTLISKSNIYVSLNYLQESPISYVADWGARSPEGGLSLFKKIEGVNQKLRIISSYVDQQNRVWPTNYEFDVIDIVLLGDNDENPLILTGEGETSPEKIGAFVVLKNNPNAEGFDRASINSNSNSRWDTNCIFELYTPSKKMEDEERFYYEIGDTYNINHPEMNNAAHSVTSITLDKGDVWWRKVPVNFRDYNEGDFEDLIQESTNLSSNFKPYYLETETASDLFKADATLIGRPNIILEDAVETIREASITYSGKSNPNSSKINYSSFNLTLSNFKDLQEEFGDINYMCNMEGDVFVIQSDRCTLVPASKTLFSDISGVDTVAASKSPLGQERVFAGRAGCDNNPESVVQVGAFVYFAHKNLGKVYRFNPSNGVQEISDQGMASYFRKLFKDAISNSVFLNYDDVRVVGGFDPVNEEYLLTVLDPLTYGVILSGNGGEVIDGSGDAADSVVVATLEDQIFNIMDAILSTEDDEGKLVFSQFDLPDVLQDFYTSGGESGLDTNADGVYNADDIITTASIKGGLEVGIADLTESLSGSFSNNDLMDIYAAIDDTNVPSTVSGIITYINLLERPDEDVEAFQTHITNVIGDIGNLLLTLDANKQSHFLYDDAAQAELVAAGQSPEEFMSVLGPDSDFDLSEILQNAQDVSNVLKLIQVGVAGENSYGLNKGDGNTIYGDGVEFNGPAFTSISDLEINKEFFGGFVTQLETVMNNSAVTNGQTNLSVATGYIAEQFRIAIGEEAYAKMEDTDIPDALLDTLNAEFGTNLTLAQIPTSLIETIQSNYITPNVGPNDITMQELASANQDLIVEIIDNYLITNPGLSNGLQKFIEDYNLVDQAGLLEFANNCLKTEAEILAFINSTLGGEYTTLDDGLNALQEYLRDLEAIDAALQSLLDSIDIPTINTIEDLQVFVDNLIANQGNGYSTLEQALQGEGINVMQLRDLMQQISVLAGTNSFELMYFDYNMDGQVGSSDLLIFLSAYGSGEFSTNLYSTDYNDLSLNPFGGDNA